MATDSISEPWCPSCQSAADVSRIGGVLIRIWKRSLARAFSAPEPLLCSQDAPAEGTEVALLGYDDAMGIVLLGVHEACLITGTPVPMQEMRMAEPGMSKC